MNTSLDLIGLRHGTDKSSCHHDYLRFYERFLKNIRDVPVRVLEVGVYYGRSLSMWAEYFARGHIVGVDIDPAMTRYQTDRIAVEIADQSSAVELNNVCLKHGPFDVVVDDGSHVWSDQIITLRALLPFVTPGGYYILEDIDTSYGSYVPAYSKGADDSAAAYLQKLTDYLVADEALDPATAPDDFIRNYAWRLEFIAYARRTCLIHLWQYPPTKTPKGSRFADSFE